MSNGAEHVGFERNIGLFFAVMIGIGAMMGPGIFALPGELAHLVGPLGVLVYLAMGLVTVFTALNYAELGSAIPIAGGGYSFASRTLPKPLAFITGWFFWIGNIAACAMYAVIFAVTLREYFWSGIPIAVVGVIVTAGFAAINLRGMSEAIKVITAMNLIELAALLGIAGYGLFHLEPANYQPIAPLGIGGFAPGMALIYVSYVGFELITVASEEIIDPGKTIPKAILITLGVGTAIYVFVVGVMMGVIPHEELAESEVPFIFLAERLLAGPGRWVAILATIMASLSAFSVTLGASARVLYALGRDGHFPKFLARLHPKYRTPHVALAVCSVAVALFTASGVVRFVASMADFGFLMGLGVVNYAVVALHNEMPALRRPFESRYFPWVPLIGVVTCWIFVPALEVRSMVLGTGLTLAGALVYVTRAENRAELRELPGRIRYGILLLRAMWRPKLRVLIICGGRQGQNIADRLLSKDETRLLFRAAEHQITFVEEDDATCTQLQKRYSVPVYQGDGTKRAVLEQVGKNFIDVAIAAFDDDGKNLIAALQAKQVGMPRVMAIIQDPDYLPLLEAEGITAVSAPWATASMVENYLDRPGVLELFELGRGVASLIDLVVPADAQVVGKPIKKIDLPSDCVVAAVIRGNEYVVPRGNTAIVAGDHVIVVGPPQGTQAARDAFTRT